MRFIAALLAASAMPVAYMTETVETVMVKGSDGKPLRVNRTDYDADQSSDTPTMTLHKSDKDAQPTPDTVATAAAAPEGVTQLPSPSAVDNGTIMQDAAPVAGLPNQLAVAKKGNKIIVVNATDGTPYTDIRIDPKGYDDDAAAWLAIKTVQANPTPLGTPPIGSTVPPISEPPVA